MKYIRTENGIYDVTYWNEDKQGYYTYLGDDFCESKHYIYNEDIIKQADTIEELCDGFIGITTKDYPKRPDIEPFINYFQKPFEFEYGNNIIKHLKLIDVELKNQNGWSYPTKKWFESCDIYGFVRTDKGLIYVAKMNEKGELELI